MPQYRFSLTAIRDHVVVSATLACADDRRAYDIALSLLRSHELARTATVWRGGSRVFEIRKDASAPAGRLYLDRVS